MESTSTAGWAGPYELQLAKNWTAEEVAPADDAQVWAPAIGHPLQYGSIADDIFGSSCSLQPYVVPARSYSSGGRQQLVEYSYYNSYAAAAQHHDPDPMETYIAADIVEKYINNPEQLFQEKKKEFKDDAKLMKIKMHRYPPSIQALGDLYTVPKVVAIGPYHHHRDHLQNAEKMKHVAAQYCIEEYIKANNNSGHSVQDFYGAVVSVVAEIYSRDLYDKDIMAGISYEVDFLPMMFYDACFLVIYILRKSGVALDSDLYDFFDANNNDIALDIMLLENQLPLQLVGAVMNMCTANPLERMNDFIVVSWRDSFMQDKVVVGSGPSHVNWNQDYYNRAPHLLGLLQSYAVGIRRRSSKKVSRLNLYEMESTSNAAAGLIELAEMGIFLTANETMELLDMGLSRNKIIFTKLSMAPLTLSDARATWLVNMAALELCTTPDFFEDTAELEDSAVCSYLLVLSLLMHREEDVQELRTKGILRGLGLDNKKTLDFFTSLHSLRKGPGYVRVMMEITSYRNKRPFIITVYSVVYNNLKFIIGLLTATGVVIGIITQLIGLKGAH